ncbi:hypothetical protein CEP54_008329 [Fusarium duplospermum]|uniref:Protein kinase domain-containing protein n=1 Tax=Fusarium duplospermum TaxID=1325734 RepID=A0A428PWM2_9HYPO|nr:hypothetical protein CEP54_008329 [Fusarium duplospermum]
MGSSLSALPRRKRHSQEAKITPQSIIGPDFDKPYRDPKSTDDSHPFPLDDQDIGSLSEEQLYHAYTTGPLLYHYGKLKIIRASKSLVIKGGPDVSKSESENMKFALETLHLPVPKVHRIFTANILGAFGAQVQGHFIVMDYIPGPTVETCWESLDKATKESVAQQVANMIEKLQSRRIEDLPPGPLGRDPGEKCMGPWFTDYGAGPFNSLGDLEAWFNHKIDVCAQVQQLPTGTPRFQFNAMVLTHQDIAPRNLILGENNKVWLIDWGCAGVYPRGFDQAVMREQSGNHEFTDMVLSKLSDQYKTLTRQYSAIAYGLSTGRLL